ncbi:radical SAM protein [Streptomyces sp. NPDC019531]|uniref:radical SAM protein n=1 Tax=Streptomyces sp. NPDC019531 TaxID=3365062 RepID=UPI00384B53CD
MTAPTVNDAAFLVASDALEIHRTAGGGYLMVYKDDANSVSKRGFEQQFETEKYFLRFLELADGTRTYRQIIDQFTMDFGDLFGPALATQAAAAALEVGLCEVRDQSGKEVAGVHRITGSSESYQPIHATFEIIETCNFTCTHCYYSSSPSKRGRISLDEAIEVIDLLAERGVRVLELTGGECTIHPDFREILAHVAKRFVLVAVITNGYLLGTRPDLLEYVASCRNVVVQVSIDGLEEHHDRWRRHRGSFRAACAALSRLVERGTPARMASSISESNLHEVVPLFQLAKEMYVAAVAFSPIAALGRGCNVTDPGLGAEHVVRSINDQLKTIPERPAPTSTRNPSVNRAWNGAEKLWGGLTHVRGGLQRRSASMQLLARLKEVRKPARRPV